MFSVSLVASLAIFASSVAFAADPIKVGVSIAQSPPGSVVQGTQVKDGIEIVKDMVNAQGGVLGRQIELVYEDNQGIPEKGRAASEKLITKDKVVAITGGHQSSVCLAEIEVAHRYGVPYVNTNCWSDDVRIKHYPEVFNPGNYNTRVSMAMAETIAAMKLKNVVAFAENTDYGIGQAKLLDKFLKEKSPQTKFHYETLDRASKDFTPAVLALRGSPPDMVINIMLPPAAYILMNQLYEQGVAPSAKTWSYDGAGLADYPDFWKNVK
jgi:ABC-type branched-subunit amino acid transport system substrate-binding protein